MKHLIKSEAEYMKLFDESELLDVEDILKVVFAYTDGKFPDDDDCNEDLETDFKVYRKLEDSIFPESYPCIVMFNHEKDWDRQGNVEFRFLDFVYLTDFGV